MLGAASPFIYCAHPMLVETVGSYLKSDTVRFFVVACLSSVAALVYVAIKRKVKEWEND